MTGDSNPVCVRWCFVAQQTASFAPMIHAWGYVAVITASLYTEEVNPVHGTSVDSDLPSIVHIHLEPRCNMSHRQRPICRSKDSSFVGHILIRLDKHSA